MPSDPHPPLPSTLTDVILGIGPPERTLLCYRSEFRLLSFTAGWVLQRSLQVASWLARQGIGRGDPVLLWGFNTPQWVMAYFGCLLRGAVAVPLDYQWGEQLVRRMQSHVGARLLFKSRRLACEELPGLVLDLERIERTVEGMSDRLECARPAPDDLALILFTSGTTGSPKGVELTHRNLVTNVTDLVAEVDLPESFTFLSVLPLSHAFEQTVGLWTPLLLRGTIVYVETLKSSSILAALHRGNVGTMVVVPRLLELLRDEIVRRAEALPFYRSLFHRAVATERLPASWSRLVLAPVRWRLGTRFRFFVAGGARVPPEIERFWMRVGLPVLTGYGLTETSPVIACNTPGHARPGTAGRVLRSQEVRLGPDGEILVRGPCVTRGYHRRDDLTAASFADGWFKTGDIGALDGDGYLSIRGRSKDVIVTGAGLKVFPEDVEAELVHEVGVVESAVVGLEREGHEVVHAVLRLASPDVDPQKIVRAANGRLAPHQRIASQTVWDGELPRTRTGKVNAAELKKAIAGGPSRALAPTPAPSLRSILAELADTPASAIGPTQRLRDLDLDSLARVELLARLEAHLATELADEVVDPERTVQEIEELLRRGAPPARGRPRWWVRGGLGRALRAALRALVVLPITRLVAEVQVDGLASLDALAGPVVFAANHQSHLDALVLVRALPGRFRRTLAIAAWEEYFFPPAGSVLRRLWGRVAYEIAAVLLDVFLLSQVRVPRSSLRFAGRMADRGASILIFPEGERTPDGALGSFRPGVGFLASVLQLPIVPVQIEGTYRMMPRGKRLPRRGTATVRFLPAIDADPAERPETIATRVREAIARAP